VAKSGERIVKEQLENKGLKVVKIPEGDIKTVDFEIYYKHELLCYLEEKTIELTPLAWKNIDPIYSSISRHIYDAIKQFKSLNPDQVVPNVLSFTSMDQARTINDLAVTLTGHVITAGGKMRPLHNMKRLENKLFLIDLYLWFDHDQLTGHIYDEANLSRVERMLEILGLEK